MGNKRGAIEVNLWVIVQLVLLIGFVFFPLWGFVLSDNNKLFERIFVSKDLALTIDSLYAAPGEVIINYDQPIQGLSFNFSPNTATVYYEFSGLLQSPSSSYYFIEDNTTKFNYAQFSLAQLASYLPLKERKDHSLELSFIKRLKEIGVNVAGFSYSAEQEAVANINTKNEIKRILVRTTKEKQTEQIIDNLEKSLETCFIRNNIQYEFSSRINAQEIKSKKPDLLLLIQVSDDPAEKNAVRTTLSFEKQDSIKLKNSKLSTLLLNKFRESETLKPFIDEIQERLATEDEFLNSNDLAVALELGNIASAKEQSFESDNIIIISNIICNAILEYNS